VRDRKRDGGPRQRARGSPIHARVAPCTNTETTNIAIANGGRPGTPEPRVSQSQYLGQGQKVLRSPVRRDTGESLARRARCTFTSPVLPCAFANCNFDTDDSSPSGGETYALLWNRDFRVCKFMALRYGHAISNLVMLRANFGIGDPAGHSDAL